MLEAMHPKEGDGPYIWWHYDRQVDLYKEELEGMPPFQWSKPDSKTFLEKYPNYRLAYKNMPKDSGIPSSEKNYIKSPTYREWKFKNTRTYHKLAKDAPERFDWMNNVNNEKITNSKPRFLTPKVEIEVFGPQQEPQVSEDRAARVERHRPENSPEFQSLKPFNIVEVRLSALKLKVKRRQRPTSRSHWYFEKDVMDESDQDRPTLFECKRLLKREDEEVCHNCWELDHHHSECKNEKLHGLNTKKTGRSKRKKKT